MTPKPSVGGLFRLPAAIGEHASDWGYAAGWRLVRAAPEFVARNAFGAGAQLAARNGGPEQLRKNLARVLGVAPEEVPDGLIRASLASYARYWREAFRLPSMDHVELGKRLWVDDIEMAFDSLKIHGRGAILALPHSGNWDMAGVWLAQNYGTFATVAERLKPDSVWRDVMGSLPYSIQRRALERRRNYLADRLQVKALEQAREGQRLAALGNVMKSVKLYPPFLFRRRTLGCLRRAALA